jgi:hypothetical protein
MNFLMKFFLESTLLVIYFLGGGLDGWENLNSAESTRTGGSVRLLSHRSLAEAPARPVILPLLRTPRNEPDRGTEPLDPAKSVTDDDLAGVAPTAAAEEASTLGTDEAVTVTAAATTCGVLELTAIGAETSFDTFNADFPGEMVPILLGTAPPLLGRGSNGDPYRIKH